LPGFLGELRPRRGECTIVHWCDRCHPGGEPLRERRVAESERDAQQGGQQPRVVEIRAERCELVELVQERLRLLRSALGRQLGGGGKRVRDERR
jgi:hypothetical protein